MGIISLSLLAVLRSMQLWMLSVSSRSPRARSAELLPSQSFPACILARGYYFPGVGLCICPWMSSGSYQPIPPSCLGLFEQQVCPWAYRLVPPQFGVICKLDGSALPAVLIHILKVTVLPAKSNISIYLFFLTWILQKNILCNCYMQCIRHNRM